MKSDALLKQDVVDELAWDPAINETEIGVEVKNGVVTLTGHLSSYAEKWAAEKAVQRVAGVQGLAVEIDVRLPGINQRTDAEIALAARNALDWNTMVPKDSIKVKVENGLISLSGTVDHDYQRKAAEVSVRYLMGVRNVNNQIILRNVVLHSNVKRKIEAALQRQVHLEAKNILVTVSGEHQVILSGKVKSWADRNTAAEAAWGATGVSDVINKMTVE